MLTATECEKSLELCRIHQKIRIYRIYDQSTNGKETLSSSTTSQWKVMAITLLSPLSITRRTTNVLLYGQWVLDN